MRFDPTRDYPLGTRRPDLVHDTVRDAARSRHAGGGSRGARWRTTSFARRPRRCCGRPPSHGPPARSQLADTLERAAELDAGTRGRAARRLYRIATGSLDRSGVRGVGGAARRVAVRSRTGAFVREAASSTGRGAPACQAVDRVTPARPASPLARTASFAARRSSRRGPSSGSSPRWANDPEPRSSSSRMAVSVAARRSRRSGLRRDRPLPRPHGLDLDVATEAMAASSRDRAAARRRRSTGARSSCGWRAA